MIKQFFPTICPECNSKLSIELSKSGTYKLMCTNSNCIGQDFKKFEKGVLSLQIRDLGPAPLKSLYDSGITSISKLFHKDFFNKEFLVESMLFKEGRALDKIINSVNNIKQIEIQKLIESLQIDNIGTSFSIQIGKYLSNVDYDFTGYSIEIRDDLKQENSITLSKIKDAIKVFEDNNIKIVYYQNIKKEAVKTLQNKKIDIIGSDAIYTFVKSLNFDIVDLLKEDCDFLIIEDKSIVNKKIDHAKLKGIKILTFNQAKILLK